MVKRYYASKFKIAKVITSKPGRKQTTKFVATRSLRGERIVLLWSLSRTKALVRAKIIKQAMKDKIEFIRR